MATVYTFEIRNHTIDEYTRARTARLEADAEMEHASTNLLNHQQHRRSWAERHAGDTPAPITSVLQTVDLAFERARSAQTVAVEREKLAMRGVSEACRLAVEQVRPPRGLDDSWKERRETTPDQSPLQQRYKSVGGWDPPEGVPSPSEAKQPRANDEEPKKATVVIFKESGKYYTTEEVEWCADASVLLVEQFAASLVRAFELPDEPERLRFSDMTAVCLDAGFPLLLQINDARQVAGRATERAIQCARPASSFIPSNGG